MEKFSLFFGLNLGKLFYSQTNNLSKTFQSQKKSASSGKRLANYWSVWRNERRRKIQYDIWWHMREESKIIFFIKEPRLNRKRRAPKYFSVGAHDHSSHNQSAAFIRGLGTKCERYFYGRHYGRWSHSLDGASPSYSVGIHWIWIVRKLHKSERIRGNHSIIRRKDINRYARRDRLASQVTKNDPMSWI